MLNIKHMLIAIFLSTLFGAGLVSTALVLYSINPPVENCFQDFTSE